MKTKLIKDSSLLIYRDEGFIWSDSSKLTDESAEIKFNCYDSINEMKIDFGYQSDSGKRYFRNLKLDINKMIELRNFLTEQIENSICTREDYYFINYNPFFDDFFSTSKEINIEFVNNIELSGYRLEFFKYNKTFSKEDYFVNIKQANKSRNVVYGKIYKTNWRHKHLVETIYDIDRYSRQFWSKTIEIKNEKENYYADLFSTRYNPILPNKRLTKEEKLEFYKKLEEQKYPTEYLVKMKIKFKLEDKAKG